MADQTRVVASRDTKVYYVNWSANSTIPADTVDWGTTWGTPTPQSSAWIDAGYTSGGLHFSTELTRADIRVDQELDPVLRPATARQTRMTTNLAEFTVGNIKVGTGQGVTNTVAANVNARGHDDWDLNSNIANQYLSVGFDVKAPGDNEALRFVGWKCQVLGSPTFNLTGEAALLIPFEMALLPDTSSSPARIAKIRDVIAQG